MRRKNGKRLGEGEDRWFVAQLRNKMTGVHNRTGVNAKDRDEAWKKLYEILFDNQEVLSLTEN